MAKSETKTVKKETKTEVKKALHIKVASDNGNDSHKIIIDGELFVGPNVYAKVRNLPNMDEVNKEFVLENIEDNLVVTIKSGKILGNFYTHSYALNSNARVKSLEVGMFADKANDDLVLINTLSQIAGHVVKKYYEAKETLPDELSVVVDMTTSLPISQYGKEVGERFANKFMANTHQVFIHIGNQEVEVEIEFDFVKVIPEGLTTTWALESMETEALADYKERYGEELTTEILMESKILHVAIGSGSTEYPVTTGLDYDNTFLHGSNNGVGVAINRIISEFRETFALPKFSHQNFSAILRDPENAFYDEAMEMIEEHLEYEANDICNHVREQLQNGNGSINMILLYGGSSILLSEYLIDELVTICERSKARLLVVPAEYTVTLEAQGLNGFLNSEIFELVKENSK